MRVHLLRVAVVALAIGSVNAFGAQQRSFVASFGSDSNPCSLLSPCRSFNIAIGQTLTGGEVVILDTAGYGPMTIGKSLKVIGPSGVYGGISVLGALSGVTTGVTIAAGSADVITLRGLDISGVPSVGPFPQFGIDIQSAGAVHIEKTSIGNFTQDTSACIHLNTAASVQVYVVDSFLRECRTGIDVNGTGTDNTTRPSVEIDNTRLEHGLNTVLTGTSALKLVGNYSVALRKSIIAFFGDGIFASNSIATAQSRAYVIDSHITHTGNAAIETTGGNSASLVINVSNSVLDINTSVLLLGHGAVRLSSNVITNNTNSLVNCGGVSANVESLGYSASTGSNLITDFNNTSLPGGCSSFITAPVIVVGQ